MGGFERPEVGSRRPPAVAGQLCAWAAKVVVYRQGQVQSRDVLDDVEQPPARSRFSISSTSKFRTGTTVSVIGSPPSCGVGARWLRLAFIHVKPKKKIVQDRFRLGEDPEPVRMKADRLSRLVERSLRRTRGAREQRPPSFAGRVAR